MSTHPIPVLDPEFSPEPGWQPLQMPRQFGTGRSFVSGETGGDRIRIHYYIREGDEHLCAKLWIGLGAEGPPGHAHGGAIAAVLDEAMGFASWVSGHPVVASSIQIRFLKKLPLQHVYTVEAWVIRTEDKQVTAYGRIFDPAADRVFAEGEGVFVIQPLEKFGALIAGLHAKRMAQETPGRGSASNPDGTEGTRS